jgi:6-phosphogluconate dehydrogenase
MDLGVPAPSISAAVDARAISSMKEERGRASGILAGPDASGARGESIAVDAVRDALIASRICAYAQGMAVIAAASRQYDWGVDLREVARIWTGGCIIRARLLERVMSAYERQPELSNLLVDGEIARILVASQERWRSVVTAGTARGIPLPGMSASLAYYDSYRSASLPQNLVQAQRDAFGAHTYQRADDPEGTFVHSEWLK